MTETTIFPESFHDKLIKFVFDNIRNVLICASLITAAGAIFRFREQMPLGGCFNGALAISLGFISLFLLVWNLAHGAGKILELWKVGSRTAILIAIPFLSIYMAAGFAVVWAVPRINLIGQSEQLGTANHSNSSLQRDAPQAARP